VRGPLQFGMFAPVPHVTVGSRAMSRAIAGAAEPLAEGDVDPAYTLARDVLDAADRSGFDLVLFAERHLGTDLEAWMLAGAAAGFTERIKLLVAVHPGLWSPQLVAKMTTTLDRMAKGRAAINLVTGWNVAEARMYGGDVMLEDDTRYIRAEEFVHVLRGMWAGGPFSYRGQFFEVDEAQLLIRPATAALPEIFTASRSPAGLDMVARIADWWFLSFDKGAATTEAMMESIARSIGDMRARAAQQGRTVRIAFNPFVAFGPTREAAMERAMRLLAPDEPDADVRKMVSRVGPSMRAGCVGTPAEVRAQLERYHEMGIDLVLLQYVPTVENAEEIGTELIAPMRTG
jgi:FMNH2-dependent dimethyl sulfone monooxygenase